MSNWGQLVSNYWDWEEQCFASAMDCLYVLLFMNPNFRQYARTLTFIEHFPFRELMWYLKTNSIQKPQPIPHGRKEEEEQEKGVGRVQR